MGRSNFRERLGDLGVTPRKSLGQNFLLEAGHVREIVAFGGPAKEDVLVEIGPGLGSLTEELYGWEDLTLIEIDPRLCVELRERFPKAHLINNDVREVDFSEIGDELIVFGNIPYSFSTDIVLHLVSQRAHIRRVVLLLQREFAERIAATPGGRDYGVLSITTQRWADTKLGPKFPGSAFYPAARVESQLLELTFLPESRYPVPEERWFFKTVKGAFFRRRKMIHNSLKSCGSFVGIPIDETLESLGIDPMRRAETLSGEEFGKLSFALWERRGV